MVQQSGGAASDSKNLSPQETKSWRAVMETVASKHWTSQSTEDFTYRIASDFLAQVETKIEAGEVTRAELAQRLDRTPGRVSQIFNPGNLTLNSAVRLVRAAGMKVALVAYDDNDPQNNDGPVNSEIFNRCWKHVGAPKTFFEFADATASVGTCFAYSMNGSTLTGGTGYAPAVNTTSCASNSSPTRASSPDFPWEFHTSGMLGNSANTGRPGGMTATTADDSGIHPHLYVN
jgi:ribosome-binding protein aMBF1 (putative translation factor)